ncbi:MAG: D-alanyl-D-alanine carboxypeptidase [Desulfovibrio sp.]|nr:D-alanyl-D-alanine carboxypeptidase [Desulfovibrio sp.]
MFSNQFRTLALGIVFLCGAALCLAALPNGSYAAPEVPQDGDLQVCSAILFDLDRDQVLFEQNADEYIPPASLTKIMSMFLALDQISAGMLKPQALTCVSSEAASTGGSRMGLRVNESVSLERLLMGMAVSSGNDASVSVAEMVGGSVRAFVHMMNAKARLLGMRHTIFLNPHGLPALGQCTTARDMLILARAYLRAHPQALLYHNTHVLRHGNVLSWNKNPLLGQYPGADGLKTGWVRASGYNLIFTAKRGNKRLLAVILGAPDSEMRSIEAFRMLDAGFQVCAGQAPSVERALDGLPRENYHPDLHITAREARSLYGYAPSRQVAYAKHPKGKRVRSKGKERRKMQIQQDKSGRKKSVARTGRQKKGHGQAAGRSWRRAG